LNFGTWTTVPAYIVLSDSVNFTVTRGTLLVMTVHALKVDEANRRKCNCVSEIPEIWSTRRWWIFRVYDAAVHAETGKKLPRLFVWVSRRFLHLWHCYSVARGIVHSGSN